METGRIPTLIDELDAKLITMLQADGRQANTELARRLGVAEATVRKRIERLLRDQVIQIGAWTDPLKVGYQTYAIIEIQVDLSQIGSVARRLAMLPEIYFVGITTGSFDIFAAALFCSNEHMHEFVTQRLARVPGIQRTVTSNITRIVKRQYAVPVTGLLSGREGAGQRQRGRPKERRRWDHAGRPSLKG